MSSLNFDDDPFGAPTNAPLSSSGGGGFDDFDAPAPAPVQQKQQPAAFPASTFQAAPAEPAAETALSQWQVQRRAVLIGRMGKAAEAKKEQAAAARHDLEKFYEERREKIARNQAINVREQKDFQEEMASVMATGTEWEKVAKVADIAPKGGKSGSRDVDRMRTVMIEMKNEKKKSSA